MASISKDLVSRVTFDETEKLILKFQKDIFLKLKNDKISPDEIEGKIDSAIETHMHDIREQVKSISKGRAVGEKLEKKIKKYLEEMAYVRSDLEKINLRLEQQQNEWNAKYHNNLQNIESMEGLV